MERTFGRSFSRVGHRSVIRFLKRLDELELAEIERMRLGVAEMRCRRFRASEGLYSFGRERIMTPQLSRTNSICRASGAQTQHVRFITPSRDAASSPSSSSPWFRSPCPCFFGEDEPPADPRRVCGGRGVRGDRSARAPTVL